MKIKVTTTYEYIDDSYAKFWFKRMRSQCLAQEMPLQPGQIHKLQKEGGTVSFSSKDPSGQTIATTTYEVEL